MFVLVLAAEADETRQAITFLIVCLVGVAVLLAMLTAWYWHYTSPRRHAEVLAVKVGLPSPPMANEVDESVPGESELDEPEGFEEQVDSPDPDPVPRVVPSRRERIEVVERSKAAPASLTAPTPVVAAPEPVVAVPEPVLAAAEPVAVPAHVVATSSTTPTRAAPDRTDQGPAGDGLSDDAWAAAMKSAFDKLQQ